MENLATSLVNELNAGSSPPEMMAQIGSLLGAAGTDWPPISAYYPEYGEDSFTLYMESVGRFCMYQRVANGDTLMVCVPIEGIRRVAEAGFADRIEVAIELEADTVVTETVSSNEPDPQTGLYITRGINQRSGYHIVARDELMGRLADYARRLRAALAST